MTDRRRDTLPAFERARVACFSTMFAIGGCGDDGASAPPEPAIPFGTYRMHVAADDPRPGCVNGDLDIELLIDDSSMTRSRVIGGRPGAGQPFEYSVFRDQITISDRERTLTGTWSFDGDNLAIGQLDGGRCEDLSDWTAAPFILVEPAQGAP